MMQRLAMTSLKSGKESKRNHLRRILGRTNFTCLQRISMDGHDIEFQHIAPMRKQFPHHAVHQMEVRERQIQADQLSPHGRSLLDRRVFLGMASLAVAGFGLTNPLDLEGLLTSASGTPRHHFNARLLHLMGLDHERLTFYNNGLERRLTNVHGEVFDEVLA